MKNIITNYKVFFTLMFVFVAGGCTKLKEVPAGVLSAQTFYKTDADFQAAISGELRAYFNNYGVFDDYNAEFLCAGAEDVTGKGVNLYDVLRPDVNGASAVLVWQYIYTAINESNQIIANISTATAVSDANKKQYEGQARYLRAMGYFYLTRWFGEIPIITADNQSNAANVGQSSVADVYKLIVADLTIAKTNLSVSSIKARPTKGAAEALLAEVYLNMAGWPLKDATKYALARDEAKAVMDMGIYGLELNYADLWKVSNKLNTKEIIFMFNGISNGAPSHFHRSTRPGEEAGWDDWYSEARFFNAFPEGPRKDASFHTVFTDANHTTWQNSRLGQPYIAKFRDAGAGATADGPILTSNGDGFFPISRYAEVLLTYAEAANMAEGGPSADALNAINLVRRRAGGYNQLVYPDLLSGMSQQDFDAAVISEREWELAFECKRWFDLVRKEQVVSANKALYPNVDAHNMLLPKPQVEVNRINGLKQNTGY